ncbi:MAG: carbon-nitrogen hydrolase family protein [Pseudomonadota bacterium]
MTLTAAALQLCSTDDPAENADLAVKTATAAIDAGATFVQTPEITNLVQRRRKAAAPLITTEADDKTLTALRALAAARRVPIHIGSLVIREGDTIRNRGYVIGPDAEILARYDKIHMFDVDLPSGEGFRESATFAPGSTAVTVDVAGARFGIAICFDLRFPSLFNAMSGAGATVLTAPSCFTAETGRAHWHILTRARAIENGAYLVAAAQSGTHRDGRTTYGHALIVDPWGTVLAEADETPGFALATLDLAMVETVRRQIPVISARKTFSVDGAAHGDHATTP